MTLCILSHHQGMTVYTDTMQNMKVFVFALDNQTVFSLTVALYTPIFSQTVFSVFLHV